MRTQHHRLLSFALAVLTTAAFAGCVVHTDDDDDTTPTLGGSSSGGRSSGGSGGRVTGGSGGSAGGGATGGVEGGAAGAEAGGSAGSGGSAGAGGSGAEGGAAPECIGPEDTTLDAAPSCDELEWEAQSCDGLDPTGLYLCRTLALTATPGAFESVHAALAGITVEDACSAEHDAAVRAVLAGDGNQEGIRASMCATDAAAVTCDTLADLDTTALTDCQQSLNMLNDVGQAQVLKCMADGSLDGDPDYGDWQDRFELLCRIPAVPETYMDTQGATASCNDVADLFGADASSVALCQRYDESWARGGFLDALVEELLLNPEPDGTSAAHAEYAEAVLGDLRRSAAPSLTGMDFCEQVNVDCEAVSEQECLLHVDFLTSESQLEVTARMAQAEGDCREYFLNVAVVGS